MSPSHRLVPPQVRARGFGAFIRQFLSLAGRRLPVLILISLAAAGPYAALLERVPVLRETEHDPNVIYDPPVLLEAMNYAPRVAVMVGFAWLLSFAVAVALSESAQSGFSGLVKRLRSALALFPLVLASTLLAMIATTVPFIWASMFGAFLIIPLLILSMIPGMPPLGGALVPLSLAPLPYFLLRLWPLPFVLMSETTTGPIGRAWALTKGRVATTFLAFLLLASFLWPLNILIELGSLSWLLRAAMQVLLNWTLPIVLGLLLFSKSQSAKP